MAEVFSELAETARIHRASGVIPSPRHMSFAKAWRRSAEMMLATCEQEDVDPAAFIRAQGDSLFSFLSRKRIKFVPGMLFGPKAVERYNKWLTSKTRRRDGLTDAAVRRIQATDAYLFSLAKNRRKPLKSRRKLALRKAFAKDPDFELDRKSLRISLVNFAASLHPDLPDRVILQKGWKPDTVVSGLIRLARTQHGEKQTETRQRVREEDRRDPSQGSRAIKRGRGSR